MALSFALALGLSLAVGLLAASGAGAAEAPEQAPLERAEALSGEVLQLIRDGRHREGIPKGREALAIREAALGPDHPEVATSLNNLAVLLQGAGEYAAARPLLERALGIWERVRGPDHPDVATSLNNLAGLLRLTGEYAGARPLHERALAIRERVFGASHPYVAQSLNNLGLLLESLGDYATARAALERALRIWERALGPDHPEVAASLNNLGLVLEALGHYRSAVPLLERALRIRERAHGPVHPEVAASLNNLGLLLWAAGDYAGARPLLEEALALWEQLLGPSHPDVATGHATLGQLLHATGDYAAARPLYERAAQIQEAALGPDHPDVATSLTALGQLQRDAGDYAAARPFFDRALRIRERALGPEHPDVATTLNALAYLLYLAGDPGGARPLAERGLLIRERVLGARHVAVAASLITLGDILRAGGDLAGARLPYERGLGTVRTAAAPEWRWRATLGLGRIHEGQGRLPEALASYREAVRTLEELGEQFGEEGHRRQYLKGQNRLEAYDALAALLLGLHLRDSTKGYDREAWAVLEAKKGRVVAEALAAARPRPGDPQAREEARKAQEKQEQALALEKALREEQARPLPEQRPERLQNLTTLLARTKAEYLGQVQAFLGRYPQYKAQFVDQQTVDPKLLAKFADRLAPGTLAVQYFASPDALYLFVVAPGARFQVKRQGVAQPELYALVRAYREHVERAAEERLPWADDGSEAYRRDVAPLKTLTRALSAHLLGPIEAELGTHSSVIVIPNDLLLYLPIHALRRVGSDGVERFLAETHRVSYVTQLELADVLAPAQPAGPAPLLALANPDGTLPAATREVRALTGIRPAVTALDGAEATKARFLALAGQFPDLHLATHALLDPERPERSYLLMAGPEESSRRLTIAEIAGLSLQSGVAILSACETAVGEQVPGAALMTLAAAFSQAGSQSIVASLWRVNDAATREFMVAFHGAVSSEGKAGAIQRAQQVVLGAPLTGHPYYWAPFILLGAR